VLGPGLEQISHQPPSVWITPTHVTVVKPDHCALAWAPAAPFRPACGWLSITAGVLFLVAQVVMWTVDQRLNLDAARRSGLHAAKIIYLEDHLSRGLHRPMLALIAIHGLLALMSGRLGLAGLPVAIVGTMCLRATCGLSHSPFRGWTQGSGIGADERGCVT
jgi:hypothetical protein